jgi:RimJ/RimL family protein N-acetyltransferase
MTTLRKMSEASFAEYAKYSSPNYARDKVESGEWNEETALDRARQLFDEMLPQGMDTPDNYFYEIVDEWDDKIIGMLWFTVREHAEQKAAYVVDIVIDDEHQRKGHASRAFRALEEKVLSLGLTGIGLNVFGNNVNARRLYDRLGYEPVNIFMFKRLEETI